MAHNLCWVKESKVELLRGAYLSIEKSVFAGILWISPEVQRWKVVEAVGSREVWIRFLGLFRGSWGMSEYAEGLVITC